MSLSYGDSIALAKLYLEEAGSDWMRVLARPSPVHRLHTAELTALEITSAIVRRARGNALSPAHATRALTALRRDWLVAFNIIALTSAHVTEATLLVERHGLRGYDAVHLAVALTLQRRRAVLGLPPLVFISADLEQLRAARAEGLAVDDANAHP